MLYTSILFTEPNNANFNLILNFRSTSTDKKVKFKSEHTVHLIKKDRTGNETGGLGQFTEPILPGSYLGSNLN